MTGLLPMMPVHSGLLEGKSSKRTRILQQQALLLLYGGNRMMQLCWRDEQPREAVEGHPPHILIAHTWEVVLWKNK